MVLFNESPSKKKPLALQMRPKRFQDFIGQKHLLGKSGLITKMLHSKRIVSLILYGPPGCGKTSLALLLASEFKMKFLYLNAVTVGVKDLRKFLLTARKRFEMGSKTLLFIDEIQKFNTTQQQVLLPFIEDGSIVFIGTSIANPMFALISALNSRCFVAELKRLSQDDILKGLVSALNYMGIKKFPEEVLIAIAKLSDGDLRKAYNILELVCADNDTKPTVADVESIVSKKVVFYDRSGDQHYDTISSFIKAMRSSDEESATYWLSKMLYAGEDPRFIARRMIIFASEDIGLADNNALLVAVNAYQALQFVGLPEAEFNLMHACIYLSRAPKNNHVKQYLNTNKEKLNSEISRTPNKFISPNKQLI